MIIPISQAPAVPPTCFPAAWPQAFLVSPGLTPTKCGRCPLWGCQPTCQEFHLRNGNTMTQIVFNYSQDLGSRWTEQCLPRYLGTRRQQEQGGEQAPFLVAWNVRGEPE
ncbi:Galectin-9B [Manis javanica]|nr:Galectin-9B [Manis javanica]